MTAEDGSVVSDQEWAEIQYRRQVDDMERKAPGWQRGTYPSDAPVSPKHFVAVSPLVRLRTIGGGHRDVLAGEVFTSDGLSRWFIKALCWNGHVAASCKDAYDLLPDPPYIPPDEVRISCGEPSHHRLSPRGRRVAWPRPIRNFIRTIEGTGTPWYGWRPEMLEGVTFLRGNDVVDLELPLIARLTARLPEEASGLRVVYELTCPEHPKDRLIVRGKKLAGILEASVAALPRPQTTFDQIGLPVALLHDVAASV